MTQEEPVAASSAESRTAPFTGANPIPNGPVRLECRRNGPKEPFMTLAFWCVLVAALLPYVPFGLASSKLNPHAPRLGAPALEGLAARAYGAHLNAFEAFPFFAAAVIVSHVVEGPSATVGWLALAFVIVRLAHMGFYLTDRQPLRSAAFFVGLALAVVIFVHPAFH